MSSALRRELTRDGHQVVTSVDSELLSHLIEHEPRCRDDLFDACNSS